MTFKDCYRLTLHTIKENSYRSVLTVIISMFLSFLIMGMMCIAISFSKNGNDVIGEAYFCENSIVTIDYSNIKVTTPDQQELLTEKHYETLLKIVEKHKDVASYITYDTNFKPRITFTDPNYPVDLGIKIVEGRQIQKSANRNEVIFNASYIGGYGYEVGGTYTLSDIVYKQTNRGYVTESIEYEFTIVGTYEYVDEENREIIRNSEKRYMGYQPMIGDIGIMFNLNKEDLYIQYFTIAKYNQTKDKNPIRSLQLIKQMLDEINKELPPGVYMKANAFGMAFPVYVDAAKSMAYDVYAQNNILRIAIILVAVIFSVVLLLMSVGSLANSVMISIDTSKKFIGLLKALGMRGKSLKMIVVLESITLITAGVLIGYLLLVALYNPLSSVISAVVSSSYGTYIEMVGFTPVMYMPFYVFAGTLVLFLIFTFLFSRGSLNKIAKMEPIMVINEVS